MSSSPFMYSREDSTAKKADSMPNILLRIDYKWPLIFPWDIGGIKIQERLSPSSRVTNFTRARVIRLLHIPEKETSCNLVGEGCVTSQKEVSVGDNTAWYKLNFFGFLCRLSSVINFSKFAPRVHQFGRWKVRFPFYIQYVFSLCLVVRFLWAYIKGKLQVNWLYPTLIVSGYLVTSPDVLRNWNKNLLGYYNVQRRKCSENVPS